MTSTQTPTQASVLEASARLAEAAASGTPCAPVRDLIGADADLAYAVQRTGIDARLGAGARRVGRKVGLTSAAVQHQLGVDQPDFGVLLEDMHVPAGGTVGPGQLLQGRVEAEVAFVLAEDLDTTRSLTSDGVREAVAHASASIEIVDSRITDWDLTFADTVADNGSSGLFVISDTEISLDVVNPVDVEMEMTINGDVASTGNGAACLGDPLAALAWLARTCADLDDPLRAGDIVLSGALGPMVAVEPGTTVETVLTVHGTEIDRVAVTFAPTANQENS